MSIVLLNREKDIISWEINIYRKGSNIVSRLKNYWVLVFYIHNYMDMIESSEALHEIKR